MALRTKGKRGRSDGTAIRYSWDNKRDREDLVQSNFVRSRMEGTTCVDEGEENSEYLYRTNLNHCHISTRQSDLQSPRTYVLSFRTTTWYTRRLSTGPRVTSNFVNWRRSSTIWSTTWKRLFSWSNRLSGTTWSFSSPEWRVYSTRGGQTWKTIPGLDR